MTEENKDLKAPKKLVISEEDVDVLKKVRIVTEEELDEVSGGRSLPTPHD